MLEAREIRIPNLLIWSQTRYRCAIAPLAIGFTGDDCMRNLGYRNALAGCGMRFHNLTGKSRSWFYGATDSTCGSESSDRAFFRVGICFLNCLQHPIYLCSITAGNAHAGSRARVTSMGGLYDAATLRALVVRARSQVTHGGRQAIETAVMMPSGIEFCHVA